MSDDRGSNIFWNIIAILAVGGSLAMFHLAWPFIEKLFYAILCLSPGALIVLFCIARLTEGYHISNNQIEDKNIARGHADGVTSEDYRWYLDKLARGE